MTVTFTNATGTVRSEGFENGASADEEAMEGVTGEIAVRLDQVVARPLLLENESLDFVRLRLVLRSIGDVRPLV